MNQIPNHNFSSAQDSQLEDGEIDDGHAQQQYQGLNLQNATQNPHSQNQFHAQLPQSNPFSKSKLQNFNPSSFSPVQNIRFKVSYNNTSHSQGQQLNPYGAASSGPDTRMEAINEIQNEQSHEVNSQVEENDLNDQENFEEQQQYSDKAESDVENLNQTQISSAMSSKYLRKSEQKNFNTQFMHNFETSSRKVTKAKRMQSNLEEEKQIQQIHPAGTVSYQMPRFDQGREEELRERRTQAVIEHERMKISAQDFSKLMKSKQEIYSILMTQGQYYLPPYSECTIDFLRDAFCGNKKLLFTHDVRMINVPKLNELAVRNLLDQVKMDSVISEYLPDLSQKSSINRQYLYNVSISWLFLSQPSKMQVINTLKPEFFPDNIRAGLEKRKEMRSIGQNKYIEIQSDMLDLLQNAINLNPSQRGRAVHLLNVGAKKRKFPERQQNQFTAPKFRLQQYLAPSVHEYAINMTRGEKRKKHNQSENQIQSSASKISNQNLNMSMIQPQYQGNQ